MCSLVCVLCVTYWIYFGCRTQRFDWMIFAVFYSRHLLCFVQKLQIRRIKYGTMCHIRCMFTLRFRLLIAIRIELSCVRFQVFYLLPLIYSVVYGWMSQIALLMNSVCVCVCERIGVFIAQRYRQLSKKVSNCFCQVAVEHWAEHEGKKER